MKTTLRFLIALLMPLMTFAGPRTVGNGGDIYALEFLGVGQSILASMQQSKIKSVNLQKLAKALDETTIESTNKPLVLKGMLKDAINYPNRKKIVFNRTAWSNYFELADKGALVLHEYLGIIGVDDSTYKISKSVIAEIGYGRLTYNDVVLERKLSAAEMRRLYPAYLKMAEAQASEIPSTLDHEILAGIESTATRKTVSNFVDGKIVGRRAITTDEKIKNLETDLTQLKQITPADRLQNSEEILKDFVASGSKVICEFGYETPSRMDPIVECRDDRSIPPSKDDEGYTDLRKIRWSVDPKTLSPINTLQFYWLQAG